jgi:hypothetical protein
MSPGLDLLILLRTPLAIVQQVCDLRAAKRAAQPAGNPPKSASKIPTGVVTAVSTQSGE